MKSETLPRMKYMMVQREDGSVSFIYLRSDKNIWELCKEYGVTPLINLNRDLIVASSVSEAYEIIEECGSCGVNFSTTVNPNNVLGSSRYARNR